MKGLSHEAESFIPFAEGVLEDMETLITPVKEANPEESLESLLKAAKTYTKGRVICVFGCGGDRDKTKRPIMGEISGKVADYTIITSDNPRTEVPEEIVGQIEEGIKKTKGNYECIVDRKEAMKKAISIEGKSDIVIIAGKGHEMYQEIQKEQIPFDEREIIKEIIVYIMIVYITIIFFKKISLSVLYLISEIVISS